MAGIENSQGGCNIDISTQNNSLEKFDTSNEDFVTLSEGLNGFGHVDYKLFDENPHGPILVIFREHHQDDNVKKENFEAFKAFRTYFNFLATEGANYELSPQVSSLLGDTANTVDFILGGFSSFSSVTLEEYYGDNLNTCGVDLSREEFEELERKQRESNSIGEVTNSTSIEDALATMETRLQSLEGHINDNVVKERNSLWLGNIRGILNSGNSHGKNFIPIIVGGEHSNDLALQAKDYGFKGVITLTPLSYK